MAKNGNGNNNGNGGGDQNPADQPPVEQGQQPDPNVMPSATSEGENNAPPAEVESRDRQEGNPGVDALQAEGRGSDMRGVPGAETDINQPVDRQMPVSQRTDASSPFPEGDTAAHNAGNASPALGDPFPTSVRTEFANQRVMGLRPDPAPSPWPVAPKPTDAGLVSPTGIVQRPAHHEAAISHLTMRLGEMRNFLVGFDHDLILVDYVELHGLVATLKHALGVPERPEHAAEGRGGHNRQATGPGSGSVARSGARFGGGPDVISTTSAGSYAQGSHGPNAVQENNH